jgi:hypothetical protein
MLARLDLSPLAGTAAEPVIYARKRFGVPYSLITKKPGAGTW